MNRVLFIYRKQPVALIVLVALILFVPALHAQTASSSETKTTYLAGYAWSSNIGWLSFSGPGYSVKIDPNGALSGYGWSSNLGWISFNANDTSGCPIGSCAATYNSTTRTFDGYGRFLAGGAINNTDRISGGWSGWLHLKGNTYTITAAPAGPYQQPLSGFAWGNDVVGWVNMKAAYIQPFDTSTTTLDTTLRADITIDNQKTVTKLPNDPMVIRWTSLNATRCVSSNNLFDTQNKTSGTMTLYAPSVQTGYTLLCSDNNKNIATDFATVQIGATGTSTSFESYCLSAIGATDPGCTDALAQAPQVTLLTSLVVPPTDTSFKDVSKVFVSDGASVGLTWNVTKGLGVICKLSVGGKDVANDSGRPYTTDVLHSSATYKVTCTNSKGTGSDQVQLSVGKYTEF